MTDPTPADIPSLVAELRELLAKASEPHPAALPEQDSRVGEMMAGQADQRNATEWRSRVEEAHIAITNALPALLDALTPKEDHIADDVIGVEGFPAGMVLVPKAPTNAMIIAGQSVTWLGAHSRFLRKVYAAMLSAAPRTPAVDTSQDVLRELLQAVRDCRVEGRDIEGLDGYLKAGAGWSVSRLTKLLPAIDAILAALPTTDGAAMREMKAALKLAIFHIEHQAAWIGKQPNGYSFEGLGEDMPGIKAALDALALPAKPGRDEEGPCTDCDDTGITFQTERICSCKAGDQFRALTPTNNEVSDEA